MTDQLQIDVWPSPTQSSVAPPDPVASYVRPFDETAAWQELVKFELANGYLVTLHVLGPDDPGRELDERELGQA